MVGQIFVGYELVDNEGNVLGRWGGVIGQQPGVPDFVVLPNGDQVHSPALGDLGQGCTLRIWMMDPPTPTGDDVDAERERRIALPLAVTLPNSGAFTIDMDADSIRNLGGIASAGILAKLTNSASTIPFRDHVNGMHVLNADDMIAMGVAVQTRIATVYAHSWAIKGLNTGIPQNFADDSFWA